MDYRWPVLALMLLGFAWDTSLLLLKRRSAGNPMPANVADVYDAETFEKWKAYTDEKTRLGLWARAAAFLTDALLMGLCAYAAFAGLFPAGSFLQTLAVALLSTLSGVTALPFDWIDTMRIEAKYGFNRASRGTFAADQVKGMLVGLALFLAIGSLLMLVHGWLGDRMILAFAAGMIALTLGISFLYPFFSRIFNKFTPLPEGELKEQLSALLERNGYRVRAIQVMDASRRSTKSNAYFTGFGKMKTIVLYDTLLESLTADEICAVFAHELGHGLHRDVLKQQALNAARMLLLALLAWLTLRTEALFTSFGFAGVNYGFALLLIMSVELPVLGPLMSALGSLHSRRAEYRADAHAVKEGYGEELIRALKKLNRENYGDLTPSPLLVRLAYTHPTLSQRIAAIEGEMEKR